MNLRYCGPVSTVEMRCFMGSEWNCRKEKWKSDVGISLEDLKIGQIIKSTSCQMSLICLASWPSIWDFFRMSQRLVLLGIDHPARAAKFRSWWTRSGSSARLRSVCSATCIVIQIILHFKDENLHLKTRLISLILSPVLSLLANLNLTNLLAVQHSHYSAIVRPHRGFDNKIAKK